MRTLAAALSATAALLACAAPAQAAAPKDPVRALKSQIGAGKGVRFIDMSSFVHKGKAKPLLRRKGTLQFDSKAIFAASITATFHPSYGGLGKGVLRVPYERMINIGGQAYLSGGMWADDLPKGKPWYKVPVKGKLDGGSGTVGWFGMLVNPAEPATLKTLVADGKRTRDGYSGTITFGRLAEISPWFRNTLTYRNDDKTVVSYSLVLDARSLPKRLAISYTAAGLLDTDILQGRRVSVETSFDGWGGKVSIKAPPAGQTAEFTDLDEPGLGGASEDS
ncbi:hypothetical protein AB0B45_44640 [Nonomuraea sp. NPDC049152]|uniref:hypothetical protein n=1 Tax=Nonomuraea sp. NPDC049152 TaxID=3154350 RepID=UPI0033F3270C